MIRLSRRLLAEYTAEQLVKGANVGRLAHEIVSVMAQDNRLSEAELLLADIDYYLESRGKVASAQMISAHELSEKIQSEVKNLVRRATNVEQVILKPLINKSVIGGLRIETATRVWDTTVSRQLRDLKETF